MTLKLFGSFEEWGEEVDLRIWIWIEELDFEIFLGDFNFFVSASASPFFFCCSLSFFEDGDLLLPL